MTNGMIIIKNVRVSFPHLFARPTINGEEGKYGAVLMLEPDEHAKDIRAVEEGIAELCQLKFKGRKIPSDKLCLRSGEDRGRVEYEGYRVLSANNKNRPPVVGRDGRIIDREEDNPVYAGCYVNAKVSLWPQDNQYGKRINCELVAIQFVSDGEPLDGSYVSEEDAVSGFDALDAEEDDFLAA